MLLHKDVELTGDVMFVNGLLFFVIISRNLTFGTVKEMKERTAQTLISNLKKTSNLYQDRGFHVATVFIDREFECIRDVMEYDPQMKVTMLNTTYTSKHVPENERRIRVIEERVRAEKVAMSYRRLPAKMIRDLVNFVVMWLNAYPTSTGVGKLSSRTIMTGTQLDFQYHCKEASGHMCKHTKTGPTIPTSKVHWTASVWDPTATCKVGTSS